MMTLRTTPASPFGRQVRIAAHLLDLMSGIRTETADTNDAADSLRGQNPLGKIPTLVLEDDRALYDSRVILEYLDGQAGGRLIPAGPGRIDVLVRQSLADGILDAALLGVYEARFRPEDRRDAGWLTHQAGKVERGLGAFEGSVPDGPVETSTVAEIALACALGYLDLRFEGRWREGHPRLVAWLESFEAAVPAYGLTRPA